MNQGDDWPSWGKHVLKELERLNENMETNSRQFNEAIGKLEVQVAMLQVKAGIFGLIGGAIPVIIMILVEYKSKA